MTSVSITVGDRIQVLVRGRGMTGRDAAKKLRMSYGHFRNVIAGTDTSEPARRKIEDFFHEVFWPVNTRG